MAVTLTAAQLAAAMRLTADDTAALDAPLAAIVDRLLATAKARIERYAPTAPADVQNEAAIRLAAYLYDGDNPAGELTGRRSNAIVNSGAGSILQPWARRHGLAL